MNNQDRSLLTFHQDTALFRESVIYSAAETGFAARLIEKDYFCSVLLAYLANYDKQCVFKGGTCLTKVHLGFYRLSEDLDYVMPMPTDAPRSQRSKQAGALKQAMAAVEQDLDCFSTHKPLQGANNSTQYNGVLQYRSLLDGKDETIKIEMSLREPLLEPAVIGQAHSILRDPIVNEPVVPTISINCISKAEAMAEKCRAALTRRDIAIRDFFDIAYAVDNYGLDIRDPKFLALIKAKLSIPGNGPIRFNDERRADLGKQVSTRLRPVLREKDYIKFDIDYAFSLVSDIVEMMEDFPEDRRQKSDDG
ncbi:nucleotidyl transferase AbiEii/AbiGii toxin family protein [Planctomycetota bacterium]